MASPLQDAIQAAAKAAVDGVRDEIDSLAKKIKDLSARVDAVQMEHKLDERIPELVRQAILAQLACPPRNSPKSESGSPAAWSCPRGVHKKMGWCKRDKECRVLLA